MRTSMLKKPVTQSASPRVLAQFARQALIEEASLSPKPALVDSRGNGAHHDLSLSLMHASAHSLTVFFAEMATAAQQEQGISLSLRARIGQIGREAEQHMLSVTQGVNTHRGAIWALGLLVTVSALDVARHSVAHIAQQAAALAHLQDPWQPVSAPSHGERVRRRYGATGARGEAQAGFPAVMQHGLPQLRRSRQAGFPESHARLDALLAIMAQLEDTCVLHRAGRLGLEYMQQGALAVLEAGGSATSAGRCALGRLDAQLVAINASPGGAADLLAATLYLDKLMTTGSSMLWKS